MKYFIQILLFFGICLMCSCNKTLPVTYYLPKDFEGVFAVVYSQKQDADNVLNGRLQFYIPDNRILLAKVDFADGWRDDVFLLKSNKGYDTLKMYLPNKDTTGRKFDKTYYQMYTNDSNEVAVNFRQIVNSVPVNTVNSDCSYEYELITIGKAATLTDSIGKLFRMNLIKYLEETICNQKRSAHLH